MKIPLFIEIDLVQAEWVVTAFYSRDARMIEVFTNKIDPHVRTGHLISGAPEALIVEEARLVEHESNPDVVAEIRQQLPTSWNGISLTEYFFPRTMSIRQAAKRCNHGLNYNMGYRRFALETEMPEGDAKYCVDNYHAAYRGIRRMHKYIDDKLRRDRTLINCFGEKRVFYDDLTQKTLDDAYAQIPQSTVSRVTNMGLCRMYTDETLPEPLANGHDSILTQAIVADAEELWETLYALDQTMHTRIEYHGQAFTLDRELKVGKDWGNMHTVKELTPYEVKEVWDVISGAA